MPNHVDTIMVVEGPEKDVQKFIDQHIKDDSFDFSTIAKMPEELDGTVSPPPRTLEEASRDPFLWGDATKEEIEEARQKVINQFKNQNRYEKEFGANNWYDWNCQNWGTKWNAYSYEEMEREAGLFKFTYQTAWDMPRPLLLKVSEINPSLTITVRDDPGEQ